MKLRACRKRVSDRRWHRRPAAGGHEPGHASLRAIVTEPLGEREDVAVRTLDDAIIYELHVGGFTRDPSSGVRHPGTFAGLIEKIP
jgi:glycogen operon protein